MIVLGFLVILTILAFSFAVSMRTERLASRAALHAVRARQHLQVALARTQADLDAWLAAPPTVFYPETNWWITGGEGAAPRPSLLEGEAAAFVPATLRPPTSVVEAVRWRRIADPADPARVLGRYACLAVNCSGLLDANAVGGAPARAHGADPAEIRIDDPVLLPEVADPAAFLDARSNTWKRFETLAELTFAPGIDPALPPDRLFPYSLFPPGYLSAVSNEAAPPLPVGGTAAELAANATALRAQFALLPGVDADGAARNLLDYVDADARPRDVASFATEATPLVNEVVVSNRVSFEAGLYVYRAQVSVELWYPFGTGSAEDYVVVLSPPAFAGLEAGLTPAVGAAGLEAAAPGPWTTDAFRVSAHPAADGWWASPGQSNWAVAPDARLEFGVELREGSAAGPVVDLVTGLVFAIGTALPAAPPAAETAVALGKSADDPRLNWRGGDPAQWADRPAAQCTLGGTNAGLTAGAGDGSTRMYVANRPVEVTGELGFLLYTNRPWRTFALHGPGALPVLDLFAAATNRSKGRVNLNTYDTNALAAVFLGQPLERHPGDPAGTARVARAQAQALAGAVYAAGPYTNRGDLARLTDAALDAALPGLDPLQREGLVRNAADLLSPRQNLFTLLLVAQSVDDVDASGNITDDEVMGEARAVAVWWRDPYPARDAEGARLNAAFVRFFKWLDE